jgi:hypothetical protein
MEMLQQRREASTSPASPASGGGGGGDGGGVHDDLMSDGGDASTDASSLNLSCGVDHFGLTRASSTCLCLICPQLDSSVAGHAGS